MLTPFISKNEKMYMLATSNGGLASDTITPASRLGSALIILGGGRRIESMRTHGISKHFVTIIFMK